MEMGLVTATNLERFRNNNDSGTATENDQD